MESEEMTEGSKLVPTLQTFRVKPKYPFGSHHTYLKKNYSKIYTCLPIVFKK